MGGSDFSTANDDAVAYAPSDAGADSHADLLFEKDIGGWVGGSATHHPSSWGGTTLSLLPGAIDQII